MKEQIRWLLAQNHTLRGIAKYLRIDKDTVARYLVLLAREARAREDKRLASARLAKNVKFDDLITFEHSKMKPLSVTVVADADRWKILGVIVARIPASGHLAEKSRKKYGRRADESVGKRHELMARLKPYIDPGAQFNTDSHAAYPPLIKRHFPQATHTRHKAARAAVVGQGELKSVAYDPIFCINHQLAMCRAHISRLFRRTWNTTKRPSRLADHLAIYLDHYNRFLQPASGQKFEAGEGG